MPNMSYLYAMDFIDVLKKKHVSGNYKEMVIYVEACKSGSIFEGIMRTDLNINVTTTSNAQENSYGTYCSGMDPSPPQDETHNMKKETIKQQYNIRYDISIMFYIQLNLAFFKEITELGIGFGGKSSNIKL